MSTTATHRTPTDWRIVGRRATEPPALDRGGVRYTIDSRKVEETILPLALERKIGVLAYFPFGGNIGPGRVVSSSLFQRVGDTPPPAWAAEFDGEDLDNIGGGIGRLPNEATRRRMAELVDSWPQVARGGG